MFSSFPLHCFAAHRDLHSFPTRRSSDLGELLDVRRRQPVVPEFPGQIDDRRRPQAAVEVIVQQDLRRVTEDRKSTRLNSSHPSISYAVFCLKKKKKKLKPTHLTAHNN